MFDTLFSKTISLFVNQKMWIPSKFFMFGELVSIFNLKKRNVFLYGSHAIFQAWPYFVLFWIGFIFLVLLPLSLIFTVMPLITFLHTCVSLLYHTQNTNPSLLHYTTLIYAYPHSLTLQLPCVSLLHSLCANANPSYVFHFSFLELLKQSTHWT